MLLLLTLYFHFHLAFGAAVLQHEAAYFDDAEQAGYQHYADGDGDGVRHGCQQNGSAVVVIVVDNGKHALINAEPRHQRHNARDNKMPSPGTSGTMPGITNTVTGCLKMRELNSLASAREMVAVKLDTNEV